MLAYISILRDSSCFHYFYFFQTGNVKNSEDRLQFHLYGQTRRCKSPKMIQKAEGLLELDVSGMFVVETRLHMSELIICEVTDENKFSHPFKT